MNKQKMIILSLLIIIFKNVSAQSSLRFGVDFYESMSAASQFLPSIKQNEEWQRIKNLYDKHVVNNLDYQEKRIPKIIHQIWLGSPLPNKYKKFQESWIKNHPDWQYILWTDKEVEELGLVNKKMYDATTNYGSKSDIARYEILYRFGGLYVDTDFECLQPFDIFNHCLDFYTGMAYGHECVAFVALIGCVPNHPILKHCIDTIDVNQNIHQNYSMNILFVTGPFHFSKALNHHTKHCTDACVAFPVGYFYPWPNSDRDENSYEQIQRWIRPETFAIHHWHISWNEGNLPGNEYQPQKPLQVPVPAPVQPLPQLQIQPPVQTQIQQTPQVEPKPSNPDKPWQTNSHNSNSEKPWQTNSQPKPVKPWQK